MEIIKEKCQFIEVITEGSEKFSVEGDVIVPDIKPDVLKILQVDAVSVITDKGISSGGIYVEGKLNVNILYIPDSDDDSVDCIQTSFGFRNRFDLSEINNDMKLCLNSDVCKIDFTLLNSRKLSVKSVISLRYEVMGEKTFEMPVGFDNHEAECKYENISTDEIALYEECDFIINDSIEIPSGKQSAIEILKIDSKIVNRDLKPVSGKLITKGTLAVCILYKTNENDVEFCEGELPFTEVFDIYDIHDDDNCNAELEISDISAELNRDNEGNFRIINIECQINAIIRGERCNNFRTITDCYFPGNECDVSTHNEKLRNFICSKREQKSIKEIITPDQKLPQITKIYNVISEPEIIQTSTSNGNVHIEGKLKVYILYLTNNKKCAVYTYRKDIPLDYTFNCDNAKQGMETKIKVNVDHVAYNMNQAGDIELRTILDFDVKVSKVINADIITDINLNALETSKDIIIYFVKPGDSLWSVGKKYSVKCNEIITINNLESDLLTPGEKLIIPA